MIGQVDGFFRPIERVQDALDQLPDGVVAELRRARLVELAGEGPG